jgi:hypothetical protein
MARIAGAVDAGHGVVEPLRRHGYRGRTWGAQQRLGSAYNRPDQLQRAFHPEARLYLSQGSDGMREVGIAEYATRGGH